MLRRKLLTIPAMVGSWFDARYRERSPFLPLREAVVVRFTSASVGRAAQAAMQARIPHIARSRGWLSSSRSEQPAASHQTTRSPLAEIRHDASLA
jgi:hypothetical protein